MNTYLKGIGGVYCSASGSIGGSGDAACSGSLAGSFVFLGLLSLDCLDRVVLVVGRLDVVLREMGVRGLASVDMISVSRKSTEYTLLNNS